MTQVRLQDQNLWCWVYLEEGKWNSNSQKGLHECILDGLRKTIGDSGTKAVLFKVELGRCVKDPIELHRHLYGIFNDGAFGLEKVIVRELFRRLNLTYEEKGSFDFAGYVSQARELSERRRRENPKRLAPCNHNSRS